MFEYGNPQVQILSYATSWVFLTLLSSIWTNCAFKIHSLISFCCWYITCLNISTLLICLLFTFFSISPADSKRWLFWKWNSNEQNAGPKKLWNASPSSQQGYVSIILRIASTFGMSLAWQWLVVVECGCVLLDISEFTLKIWTLRVTAIISHSAIFQRIFHS